ncbi:DEAD/DEAH box helicase [Micromonospora zingiberis]|uniref:DEAD/DEAH box helicase n=1 Tax=Micromonospora zingiberis TaxID=2053011 RepID=A0A4R0GM07_9ACTN|nr:DEAD/DEAH box helicase [Micromonospora zingiberis]TCB98406.1 DEAD/DEAH box helicase [Micromonospora zingiberis]
MAARRPRQTISSDTITFADLGVPDALNRVLAATGVQRPFPIQAATLPDALAGRDVLGRGRTGSGKTYAFVLAVLTRLAATATPRRAGRPRALILAPTRELAAQIDSVMAPLAQALSLRTMTIFGGVAARPQIAGLRAGVDVLVACPGRLADHVDSGHAHLDAVEITVLDEADHMADLGFLPTVRRLLEQTPRGGQRLLFSATLDAGVDVLVRRFLTDPAVHSVDSTLSPVTAMAHHVLHVHTDDRFAVLVELTAAPGRTVVFTRTKRGAKTLTRRLVAAGVTAVELHGNLAQAARTRNLQAFSDGQAHTLVATDIAARGIHVDDVALVVHADPPVEHKAYLHRSGRTARAGAAGTVVTLMTDGQVPEVRELTRKAGIKATTTRLRPGDALLRELAPGERTLVPQPAPPATDSRRSAPATGSRREAQATGSRRGTQGTGSRSEAQPAHGGRGRRGGKAAPTTSTRSAPTRSGAAAFSARARPGARRGGH